VEPFVGGGAEYWNLNNLLGENVINDFDPLLTNFYTQFRNGNRELVAELARISSITDHDKLEREYYRYRDLDKNNGLGQCSDTVKAIRFYIVNQLAFSGMRRFNADGEFNVPFGHYKGLNSEVLSSSPHFLLLNKTEVRTGDFEQVMKDNDTESTYHFIDGPYTRVFKEYSAGNEFGVQDQRRLADTFKSMKHASVMIIIDKSDLTVELYRDYIKSSYELRYGVNIKNRSRFAVPDRSIDFLSRNQGEC
jgi:DNA adenine methylase